MHRIALCWKYVQQCARVVFTALCGFLRFPGRVAYVCCLRCIWRTYLVAAGTGIRSEAAAEDPLCTLGSGMMAMREGSLFHSTDMKAERGDADHVARCVAGRIRSLGVGSTRSLCSLDSTNLASAS
jgi:hypothetical protein